MPGSPVSFLDALAQHYVLADATAQVSQPSPLRRHRMAAGETARMFWLNSHRSQRNNLLTLANVSTSQ